jgi:hypothetical protein
MDDEVFQKENEASLGGADREKEIDHGDDRAIAPQDKNTPAIWLLENEAQTLKLFLLVRAEVFLLAEKLAQKIGEFVQVFENGGLDNDFAHGHFVIP